MAASAVLCSECADMFSRPDTVTRDVMGAYVPLSNRLNRYLFAAAQAADGRLPVALNANATQDCQFCSFVVHLITTVGVSKNHGYVSRTARKYHKPCLFPYNYAGMHLHHKVTWQAMLGGRILNGGEGLFMLCDSRGQETPKIQSLDAESTSTESHAAFARVMQWIKTCEGSHHHCRSVLFNDPSKEVAWLPSRLIRLDATSSPWTVRLIETSDTPIVPNSDRLYATLSYCWGPSPTFKKLIKDNLQEFKVGLSIDTLSKTFRDALVAISRLGLDLIWIDALCIIQDSEHDWKIESTKMSQVYAGAFVNLAAAASSDADADGGLFRERDPSVLNPVRVNIKWPGYLDGSYYCVPQDAWVPTVDHSPLTRRAWVFQERLLSIRTVYFTRDQLYWECEELCASEVFPSGGPWDPGHRENEYRNSERLPKGMDLNPDGRIKDQYGLLRRQLADSPITASEFPFVWALLVEQYTKCKLTYGRDRLLAISGVANQISNHDPNHDYVVGLWRQHLPLLLLWHTTTLHDNKAPAPGKSTATSQPYLAPSWSWASHLNPVLYPLIFKSILEPEIYIKVLKIAAPTGVTQLNLGNENLDGSLVVRGKLCEVKALVASSGKKEVGLVFPGRGLQTATPSEIYLDSPGFPTAKSPTFCLKVASGHINKGFIEQDTYICGLLLTYLGRKGEYKRIGYFAIALDKLTRSWRADRWFSRGGSTGPSRFQDRQILQDELFGSVQIDEMFYQDIDDQLNYTIAIL